MKFTTITLLLFSLFISCQDSNSEKNAEPGAISETTTVTALDIPFDSVVNKSFVTKKGERFLRLEVIIPASIDSVWEAFSTVEGVKTWMAPVSQLDFKVGGIMKNHMNYKKKIGDPGTFTLGIVNYVPKEMLTYKVNLDHYFGQVCAREDGNLQEVIQLKAIDKYRTKLTSSMIGWGKGPEWEKAYVFFEGGNKWCYDVMIKRFKNGPIYWPNDP